ncbi:MAG: glutathione S-transferase family protein [Gaiellales bacterium]
MITLYGIPGTATTAPHMVLEEIGALYDFVLVERTDDGVPTAPPGYLEMSPFGKVPTLKHNELVLTESAAICLHLADAFPDHHLIPKVGTDARSEAMRWLIFLTNTVQAAYMRFFYPARHTADANGADDVVAAAVTELTALRDEIVKKLGAGPFLLGDTFTIADIYLAMLSSWGTELEGDANWWSVPALAAHYDAVLARPGCRKAVEDEGGALSAG